MGDEVADILYCLTNTIDRHSTIGNRYYHKPAFEPDLNIVMRPRIPIRYDFHDAEAVPIPPKEAQELLKKKLAGSGGKHYQLKRTTHSTINTLLSNVLAVILITASLVNMRRILRGLQEDTTLTDKDRVMFQVGFALSFIVVLFLTCYLAVAWFELYRSRSVFFPHKEQHGFRYFDLTGGTMRTRVVRVAVSVFVLVVVAVAVAETLNLFFANNPAILFLLLPVVACLLLLVNLHTTIRQAETATPQQKAKQKQQTPAQLPATTPKQKKKQQQAKNQQQMPTQLPAAAPRKKSKTQGQKVIQQIDQILRQKTLF